MTSWRLRRLIPFLLLVLLLVLGAWVAWVVWHVNEDLTSSVDDVEQLRSAAEASDVDAMNASLEELEEHSGSADERTSGLTWSVLTKLPWVGDDARGVRVVSEVVHDLAIDGAQPLVTVSADLDRITPQDGAVSIEAIRDLQTPVEQAATALDAAVAGLNSEDPVDFVMRLRTKYRELATTLRDARSTLSSASTALEVLPSMLGDDEERNYLLVFQNNAEIRATGGLPGAVALLRTEDGKIELTRQVAANSFANAPRPVLPLSDAERTLYQDLVGTFFLNANLTPDFPRVAALMATRWEQVYPEDIDGVLTLDTVALSYILAATGPVQVGDTAITSDNAVRELLHEVYLRYEDPADQDVFFRRVARRTFDQVSTGIPDPQALLQELARGAEEGRVLVHSFDPTEQQEIAGTQLAGEAFAAVSTQPQVDVTLNDATGAKMSYFLRYDVRVRPTYCKDDVQGYAGSVRLESTAPPESAALPDYVTGGGLFGAEPGTQFVTVRIYSPAGGSLSDFRLNAKRLDPDVVDQEGRLVEQVFLQLGPGQALNLDWRMTSGPGQTGDTSVRVTPSVSEGTRSSTTESACS
ncbi:DUF4012 domain-containing protein [Nocardioides dongkuii]|uniref:DUF4012 domain-containing protein n=1 Tax=Nocardioides dongkuii TaxID=2760089 RepID=UPI0015FE2E1F|nr:DUF4012 domain-containing protein [Nocardioides dongkuii]